jgi:exosortase/archaeosortase family protein
MDEKQRRQTLLHKNSLLTRGVLFCLVVILLDLAAWYLGRGEYLAFLDIFTSYVITGLIHISGLPALRDSNTIYLTNAVWVVTTECTALFIMLIFSSFILVFPSSLKAKIIALLSGIPCIFAANILRLYAMAWIDYLRPQFSEYFHNYVWQVFFILMVVLMWLFWIDKVARQADSRESGKGLSTGNP